MGTAGVDYLDCDSLLTEEQRLIRDTVGSWVDEKVLPIIEAGDVFKYAKLKGMMK